MKRRDFLKYSTSTLIVPTIFSSLDAKYITVEEQLFPTKTYSVKLNNDLEKEDIKKILDGNKIEKDALIEDIKEVKIKKDIFLDKNYLIEFVNVKNKLKLIQRYVGYGNFNILSFDEMLKIARYSNKINEFTQKELEFLESIFYYNPSSHGFYGERVSKKITDRINKKEVNKIPRTGHYLFKGEPQKIYNHLKDDIGSSLILTSGVRSIVKQTKLFLDKIDSVGGNLSIASKSLAPPAYTYHSIADFDVGKKGFGHANFTPRFAFTQEFLKMRKLKYIEMRYTINNKDGVRYEPWHVKVI
jgi:hypothetical protein